MAMLRAAFTPWAPGTRLFLTLAAAYALVWLLVFVRRVAVQPEGAR